MIVYTNIYHMKKNLFSAYPRIESSLKFIFHVKLYSFAVHVCIDRVHSSVDK